MARWAALWLGIGASCALAGGCKSSDDDADPVTLEQYPSASAQAICDNFGSCCADSHFNFDATNCKATLTRQIQQALTQEYLASSTYDAAAAGECLREVRKGAACGGLEALDIPACSTVFTGALAAGQPCTSNSECKQPAYCAFDASGTGQGVCEQALTAIAGKAGDACNDSCSDPATCVFGAIGADESAQPARQPVACYRGDGLYCEPNVDSFGFSVNPVCKPLLNIGDACSSHAACKDGLFCSGFGTGHCTAPHPDGATCESGEECQSHFCDGDTGTCSTYGISQQACANGTP